jgi:alpha-D-xyloside xylohydrolase
VVRLFVRRPADTWQLSSELGALVDYYYIFGGRTGGGGGGSAGVHYEQTVRGGGSGGGSKMDSVVAGYRRLTGAAPLYPRWAFGFWQCKEHYASQVQVQDAVAEFRRRQIPLDAIVQDWQYWGRRGWGPHWDHRRYPDPKL